MTDPKLRVLISAEQIQARIRELGEKISADYPTGNLHMICILKGAVFFMTDLARAMKRDVQLDFMGISTYGKGKTSSGEVKVTKDLDISLEGADVLIVEDIVDSGVTLNYLMHLLDQRKNFLHLGRRARHLAQHAVVAQLAFQPLGMIGNLIKGIDIVALVSLPLLLFELYGFVLPAFSPREKAVALPVMMAVPSVP